MPACGDASKMAVGMQIRRHCICLAQSHRLGVIKVSERVVHYLCPVYSQEEIASPQFNNDDTQLICGGVCV